jgi:AcrR family transcriptional regulator
MGRPREFNVGAALASAQDLFWSCGFSGSSLSDLERVTGVSRPSLYGAFGSKEELFAAALNHYIDTFIADLFQSIEAPNAVPADATRFFRTLAVRFSGDPELARRGCFWVNSIAEFAALEGGDRISRATEYRRRLNDAFDNARGSHQRRRAVISRRMRLGSRTLTAATLGVWLEARVDPAAAAQTCRVLAIEMQASRPKPLLDSSPTHRNR